MAKIDRKTQKIFGSGAGGTGITKYGTPAGGSAEFSTDLDEIQTADWLIGWAAAALAGTEIPTFQDFNAIHYVFANQIGYMLQEGIAEYDAATEYYINSIVKKTGTYELYGSKIDTNVGNALPAAVDDANWQFLGDLAALVNAGSNTDNFSNKLLHVQDQKATTVTGGTATAVTWNPRTLNTVVTNEITGSSLSSDEITLPAGTYYYDITAPAYRVDAHKLRLNNVTDVSVQATGRNMYTEGVSNVSTDAKMTGRFTIASPKAFDLEHFTNATHTGTGLGPSVNDGSAEVYADVKFWKVG